MTAQPLSDQFAIECEGNVTKAAKRLFSPRHY